MVNTDNKIYTYTIFGGHFILFTVIQLIVATSICSIYNDYLLCILFYTIGAMKFRKGLNRFSVKTHAG